jgi:type II secretory pathway component GspD/PulD (secretin)
VVAAGLVNPFVNVLQTSDDFEVLSQYRELVTMLSNGQTDRFNQRFQTISSSSAVGVLAKAYEDLARAVSKLNQMLIKFDADTVAIQDGLMRSTAVNEGEVSPAIMARGLMDRNVCPGQELITEKLFVYQEAPAKVMEFLEGYFNANDTRTLKATKADEAEDAPAAEVAKPAAAAASSASAAAKPAVATVAKEAGVATAVDRCATESAKSSFKVIKDPTGVIVTGSVQQIELAARLADDVDIATKQVLAEVFLVEVQKNWERTIQTKFGAGNTSRALSVGAVGNVIDAATLATAKGINGAQGKFTASSPDITGFINLLETNAVGRNISSPTLIAKNGEDAEINKVITLRKTLTTPSPIPANSTIAPVPNQQVKELQVPLKLKIKPSINIHNKHVTLIFEYEETSLNADPADSPIEKGTTKNSIKTTLETAPGDVVVLAGLFKEANSKSTNSIPGGSGLGVFAPLLGGSDAVSTLSTELLVFIKPTVVEPRAHLSHANSVR